MEIDLTKYHACLKSNKKDFRSFVINLNRNRYSCEARRRSDILQGNVPAGRRTLEIIYDIHENALSIYIEMSQLELTLSRHTV